MKLTWNDKNADIGTHTLTLTTDDGSTEDLNLWDYTCPFRKKEKEENKYFAADHPYGFKFSYCCGFLHEETFPESCTLEEVKRYAEDYLLDMFINGYKNMLERLPTAKLNADQAQAIKDARR